jgi:hypothetical protein
MCLFFLLISITAVFSQSVVTFNAKYEGAKIMSCIVQPMQKRITINTC